jgi:hypothetical protein
VYRDQDHGLSVSDVIVGDDLQFQVGWSSEVDRFVAFQMQCRAEILQVVPHTVVDARVFLSDGAGTVSEAKSVEDPQGHGLLVRIEYFEACFSGHS